MAHPRHPNRVISPTATAQQPLQAHSHHLRRTSPLAHSRPSSPPPPSQQQRSHSQSHPSNDTHQLGHPNQLNTDSDQLDNDPNTAESSSHADKRRQRHRPKNLQACDRCRLKKIKCQPLDESRRNICQSCFGAHTQCSFDLPLTASRTKRVRRGLGLEPPAPAPGSLALRQTHRAGTTLPHADRLDGSDDEQVLPKREGQVGSSVRRRSGVVSPSTTLHREGPTSVPFIIHSSATISLHSIAQFDAMAGYSMHKPSDQDDDGYIVVSTPGTPPTSSEALLVLQSDSWQELASSLVDNFFIRVALLIPIVTREEASTASETLLRAMAAVAAARSNVPQTIFDALRYLVNRDVEDNDVTIVPTLENVQILLVISLVDELAMRPGQAAPACVARARLSAAISLARDLELHRATTGAAWRIWRCAQIIDTWQAAKLGQPPFCPPINVPIPVPPSPAGCFFTYFGSLTDILGRMLHHMYGPDGLKYTTNEALMSIQDDLMAWNDNLPSEMKLSNEWQSQEANLLQLAYTAMRFLIYRPFMRWSFVVPARFEVDCGVQTWMEILAETKAAIEFAIRQEDCRDILFFGPYCFSIACLVHYHTWSRRGEREGAYLLERAKLEGVDTWTKGWADGYMPLLRRQLAIVPQLYYIMQSPGSPSAFDGSHGLNPTPGISTHRYETEIAGVSWLHDPSLPEGGVLIATHKAAREFKDLPAGTVIIGSGGLPQLVGTPGYVSTSTGNTLSASLTPHDQDQTAGPEGQSFGKLGSSTSTSATAGADLPQHSQPQSAARYMHGTGQPVTVDFSAQQHTQHTQPPQPAHQQPQHHLAAQPSLQPLPSQQVQQQPQPLQAGPYVMASDPVQIPLNASYFNNPLPAAPPNWYMPGGSQPNIQGMESMEWGGVLEGTRAVASFMFQPMGLVRGVDGEPS